MTALSPRKHPPGLARPHPRHRSIVAQALRYLGAVEVAASVFLFAFLVANGTGLQKIRTSAR